MVSEMIQDCFKIVESLILAYAILVLSIEMYRSCREFVRVKQTGVVIVLTARHLEEHLALGIAVGAIHALKIYHFLHINHTDHLIISLFTAIITVFIAQHFRDERTGKLWCETKIKEKENELGS